MNTEKSSRDVAINTRSYIVVKILCLTEYTDDLAQPNANLMLRSDIPESSKGKQRVGNCIIFRCQDAGEPGGRQGLQDALTGFAALSKFTSAEIHSV
jgi:hypothetical protein